VAKVFIRAVPFVKQGPPSSFHDGDRGGGQLTIGPQDMSWMSSR
jgi:hypothetical protein